MPAQYDSHTIRHELFIASAVVAAHSSFLEQGFRQRDVKFLIELFSNWVEAGPEDEFLTVQNTQLSRYIEFLVTDGFARRVSRSGYPRYRLTRTGLLELISRLASAKGLRSREQFLFLYYFISNYGLRIEALVKAEGPRFPYSLKIELDALLDVKSLLEQELERTRRQLQRLERRIEDNQKTAEFITRGLKQNQPMPELVAEVERLFPYELNSQKPLGELLRDIPPDQRSWELITGNLKRNEQIFKPARTLLRDYIDLLRGLKT